ncbi:MAG: hypothetical protein ABFE02_04820, partial [Sulfuricella sp.]
STWPFVVSQSSIFSFSTGRQKRTNRKTDHEKLKFIKLALYGEALVVELTGAARLYRAASSDRRERG